MSLSAPRLLQNRRRNHPHHSHSHPHHHPHRSTQHRTRSTSTMTTTATKMMMMTTTLLPKLTLQLMRGRVSHVLVFLAVLCLAVTRSSSGGDGGGGGVFASEIDPATTLQCHVREYSYRTSKSPILNERGELVTCEGIVQVNTCWGRCDSYEVGDFQMPFKVSHHPVCTYAGYRRRVVTLGNCRGYPDPTIEVFDATACACRPCDSADTSCENLDG